MCGPGKHNCQPFCGPEGRFDCSDSVCSLRPAPFSYLRERVRILGAPVQPRRPSTLTLVLIRRWTHLIPPLTPHSPFVPATSCPDPNIDPQVDQAYFAPHPPVSPHGFNYDISKTSLLYRLSLICFWHLRTLSKNRTNQKDFGCAENCLLLYNKP